MTYKLSIITVCFNAAHTIEKTIDSLVKNKTKNIEYIVVDGASKDDTLKILHHYDKYIDILISEEDNGMYDALNKGIQVASGEYVMLLAADDQLIDGSIDKALNIINKDTDVFSGAIIQKTDYGLFYEESDPDLEQLKVHCSLKNPASIFKKNAFEKYGYYSNEFKCSGDRELFLRFYLNNAKFQVSDIPLVVFNMGGMSTDLSNRAIPESKMMMKQYGLYRSDTEEYYHKMIRHEKIKMRFLSTLIGRIVLRICYSAYGYSVICKVKKKKNNRLTKQEIEKYNIEF